jgi:hypothetical protein
MEASSALLAGGNLERFEIADDERLIGCEIHHVNNFIVGVTWIKMKMIDNL